MRARSLKASWPALVVLLICAGCGSSRRVAVNTPGEPGADSSPDPPSIQEVPITAEAEAVEEMPPVDDASDPLEERTQEAEQAFQAGKQLLDSGDTEGALNHFREALGYLEEPALDAPASAELERRYHDLLSRIQSAQVERLADPAELQAPLFEPSPLDEIGDVNLYTLEVDPKLAEVVSQELREIQLSIPLTLNDVILKFLNYYQDRGRRIMEKGLARSGRYLDLFRRIFAEEGVPEDLIYMAQVESLFNPHAYSRARALGVWQLMAGTGRLYDLEVSWWLDERSDVEKSTRVAARYLKYLYEKFQDWPLALAAYNAGPGRIERVIRRHGALDFWTMSRRRLVPRETRNHVPSILAAIIIFRNPALYGFDVAPEPALEWEKVPVDYQVDLRVVSEEIDVPLEQLRDLNPQLRRDVTPFDGSGFELAVPVGLGDRAAQILAELPPEKRLRWRHHRVQSGETLSQIAREYRTSIRAIAEVNHIRNVSRLKIGQDLVIPLSVVARGSSNEYMASRGAGSYVVRRGDSLYRIALRHGVSVKELSSWNNLNPESVIHPGQKLVIRGRR